METKIENIRNEEEWNNFVLKNEKSSIFHTIEWRNVISSVYGFEPVYLTAGDESNISGILPLFKIKPIWGDKKLVSLPFSYITGPLGENEKITKDLVNFALNLTEKMRLNYLELRTRYPISKETNLKEIDYYSDPILRLSPNCKEIWGKIHKNSIRRPIKKAENSGVTVKRSDDISDLQEFNRLNQVTRKKHGIPAQPFKFFQKMWEEMKDKNLMQLLLARHDEKTIGGMIFFTFKKSIIYAYGASDPQELNYYPNHIILWEMIKWGCENNFSEFSFGRTSPEDEGLFEFKKRWGTELLKLNYYYSKPLNPASMDRKGWKYRMLTGTWKRLPSLVTKKLDVYMMKKIA